MKKINPAPFLLLAVLAGSIVCYFVLKSRIAAFIAVEILALHLPPPFTALVLFLYLLSEKTDEKKSEKISRSFVFRERKWEKHFYNAIRIKEWKNRFGTYDDSLFKIDNASLSKTVIVMTQSELVHWVAFVLSFVPLILYKYFGHLPVLILFCILFALMHLPYIFIQRYNRPRLLKLQKQMTKKLNPESV